jgi:hypothetical protein
VSADYGCNPDYNVSQLGVVTRWTPVNDLTFAAEVATRIPGGASDPRRSADDQANGLSVDQRRIGTFRHSNRKV